MARDTARRDGRDVRGTGERFDPGRLRGRARPAPDPVIPFGKHRGQRCSWIPARYLDWLIGQDWLRPGLRARIEAHLQTRADWKRIPTCEEED